MQCLETVFDISLEGDNSAKFPLPANLNVIFESGMRSLGQEVLTHSDSTSAPPPSGPVDREKAEKHKAEGKIVNIIVYWNCVFYQSNIHITWPNRQVVKCKLETCVTVTHCSDIYVPITNMSQLILDRAKREMTLKNKKYYSKVRS